MPVLRSAKPPSSPTANNIPSTTTPIRKRRQTKSNGTLPTGPESSPMAPMPRGLTPDAPTRRRASSARPERVSKSTIEFAIEHEHREAPIPEESRSMQQSPTPLRSKPSPLVGRSISAPEIPTDQDNSPSRPRSGRAKSDPLPKKSEIAVNRKIEAIISEGPKKAEDRGYNYIFIVKRSSEEIALLKVGWTKNIDQRRSRLISTCKYDSIEELPDGVSSRMKYSYIAERLMLAELENFKWQGECCCRSQHKELFDLPEQDIIVAVFKRWLKFCREDPWDEERKLKPFWVKRLQEMGPYSTVKRSPYDPSRVAQRWENFINVPDSHRLRHDATTVAEVIKPLRWQTLALVEAIIIAFLTFPSIYSFWWVCFLALCQLVESMGMKELWSKDLITKLLQQSAQDSSTEKGPGLGVSTPTTTRGANDSAAVAGDWPHGDSGTEDEPQDELPSCLDEEMNDLVEEDEDIMEDEITVAQMSTPQSAQIPERDIPRQSVESDEFDPEITLPKLQLPGSEGSPFYISDSESSDSL